MTARKKVYIIGSKGIPASYGGFETFLDRLVSGRKSSIDYVITGMGDEHKEYYYQDARCVQFKTGNSAKGRVLHTLQALRFVYKDAKVTKDAKVLYVLGCRAGVFLWLGRGLLKKQNIKIIVNPDGAEWKRAKWNIVAKQIVKFCEVTLVSAADVVVCDAKAILDIIHKDFKIEKKKLKFIAYGSDVYSEPKVASKKLERAYREWLKAKNADDRPYYLMVGRFVPENNFELIIKEFMRAGTPSNLIIVSNVSDNKFYKALLEETNLKNDSRIKFVGTLYDQDLLKLIRARATAYIHGHEVGGTNPSLLEALGSTNVNLIYDVSFNREVVSDAGYYFNDTEDNLAELITATDAISKANKKVMGVKAKKRIETHYNWRDIISDYERLFSKD
jgi:rhamnosyltransferase